jgi:hypothetical protein
MGIVLFFRNADSAFFSNPKGLKIGKMSDPRFQDLRTDLETGG